MRASSDRSAFVDGIHYAFLDVEHRLIAVPGNKLKAVSEPPANGQVGGPGPDQPRA